MSLDPTATTMNQLITVTSDHDSSLVIPSQFELFAPEVRANIYRCLFPDLHS